MLAKIVAKSVEMGFPARFPLGKIFMMASPHGAQYIGEFLSGQQLNPANFASSPTFHSRFMIIPFFSREVFTGIHIIKRYVTEVSSVK
ncbi:hypothetical protein [Paenibacillus sp. KN14-4R]|uniref:hypothetical protein n=1 Tax=Paenibacillus sp. KN14-4R TaxID=3445773 RepID=UPI003FA12410